MSRYEHLCDSLLDILDGKYDDGDAGDIAAMSPKFRSKDEFEEAVCAAVCKLTKMRPDRWEKLNNMRRTPWLEEAIGKATAIRRTDLAESSVENAEESDQLHDLPPSALARREVRTPKTETGATGGRSGTGDRLYLQSRGFVVGMVLGSNSQVVPRVSADEIRGYAARLRAIALVIPSLQRRDCHPQTRFSAIETVRQHTYKLKNKLRRCHGLTSSEDKNLIVPALNHPQEFITFICQLVEFTNDVDDWLCEPRTNPLFGSPLDELMKAGEALVAGSSADGRGPAIKPLNPTDTAARSASLGNEADVGYPQPTRADCQAALQVVERILQHVEVLFRYAEPNAAFSKEGLESFADGVVELGQECRHAFDIIPKVTFLLPQTLTDLRVLGIAATTYHEAAWYFGLEILNRINLVIGGYEKSHRMPTKELCLAEAEKALRELRRVKMDLVDFDLPIGTRAVGEFRHAIANLGFARAIEPHGAHKVLSPASPSLADLALRVDQVLLESANLKKAKKLAEACLADEKLGHVDALQFPNDPNNPHDWTPESLARENRVDKDIILTKGQTLLALAALHAVYCPAVDKVISTASIDHESGVASDFRRAVRWEAILDRVRKLGHYAVPWFTLQLRRFELMVSNSARATPNSAYPSPDTFERDEWIFEQRQQRRTWRSILSDLEQMAFARDWEPLCSENAARDAVKRIAHHHGRDIPPVKAGRPRKTPQTPQ